MEMSERRHARQRSEKGKTFNTFAIFKLKPKNKPPQTQKYRLPGVYLPATDEEPVAAAYLRMDL